MRSPLSESLDSLRNLRPHPHDKPGHFLTAFFTRVRVDRVLNHSGERFQKDAFSVGGFSGFSFLAPRRACSQATTGLVNSCGRLKPDINYVINLKWWTTMFCLQVCWLLLHSFKSILLYLTTNTSHSKEDLMSSRSCNLLVRDEGLLDLIVFKPRQRWFWGRPARASA